MQAAPGPLGPLHTREVLDSAVRCLAVSRAGLLERLQASAVILFGQLSRADLGDPEDRALFDQIQVGLTGLELSSQSSQTAEDPAVATGMEHIANEILDLRDTIMGHAIREAAKGDDEPLDWPYGLDR